MGKTLIILLIVSLFLTITFLVWKLTVKRYKKEFGEKRRKIWGQKTFYWESVIGISTGVTFVIVFLLKCGNVFEFLGV